MSSLILSSCSTATRSILRKQDKPLTRCLSSVRKLDPTHSSTGLPKPRLDYRDISENAVFKSHNAFNRKAPLPVGSIQTLAKLYEEHKNLSSVLDAKRNARSIVGDRIRQNAKDPSARQVVVEEAKVLKGEITELETKLEQVEENLFSLALAVPNDTHPDVPIGPETIAVTLSERGPEPIPPSPERDHVRVGRALNLLDLEAGALVSGSSWYYLLNEGALLEIALINYALSIAIKHGFKPVTTPDVVRSDIAYRCGFQPRDPQTVSQMYHVTNAPLSNQSSGASSSQTPDLVLAGTAEIPLGGMFANRIIPEQELPMKVVGLGRAFRAEAGARGADTRGLYRVHQFTKLELFVVCGQEQSEGMMEELRNVQTEIFEGLGLRFRILDMPTEELGASAYRKYDMEAWMPGRGGWGEISSTSNCTDYQARRLHIRYRRMAPSSHNGPESTTPEVSPSGTSLPFAHTLNGTAAAIPRLIVALLENGAQFDEKGEVVGIALPQALRPFWVGGLDKGIISWV